MGFNGRRRGGGSLVVPTQQPADSGTVAELTTAIREADLALALIDLSDLTFLSVSRAALAYYGLPSSAVVGRPATDFVEFGERGAAGEALRALGSGAINVYVAHRRLHAPVGA